MGSGFAIVWELFWFHYVAQVGLEHMILLIQSFKNREMLLLLPVFFLHRVMALAVLEFTLYIRLASNSERSTCLCLPTAVIKDVRHQAEFKMLLLA